MYLALKPTVFKSLKMSTTVSELLYQRYRATYSGPKEQQRWIMPEDEDRRLL
jgi:hypothetical protein